MQENAVPPFFLRQLHILEWQLMTMTVQVHQNTLPGTSLHNDNDSPPKYPGTSLNCSIPLSVGRKLSYGLSPNSEPWMFAYLFAFSQSNVSIHDFVVVTGAALIYLWIWSHETHSISRKCFRLTTTIEMMTFSRHSIFMHIGLEKRGIVVRSSSRIEAKTSVRSLGLAP